MLFTVVSDLHLYGPHSLGQPKNLPENVVWLGDIFDLRNCEHSKVDACKADIARLKLAAGQTYVRGNHELYRTPEIHIVEDILFTHGDLITWGLEKSLAFRAKSPGKGRIGRRFTKFLDNVREMRTPKIKREYLQRAFDLATQYSCHYVVCGHLHPKEILHDSYTKNGVTITLTMVPRGVSEIEFVD